jgi:hypothetical protein
MHKNNSKRIEKVSITKRKIAGQGEHDEAAERRERARGHTKQTEENREEKASWKRRRRKRKSAEATQK